MGERKRKLTVVSTLLVLFLGMTGLLVWFGATIGQARLSALDLLSLAAYNTKNAGSVHMLIRMRTATRDSFHVIDPNCDLVQVELWKEFCDPPRWRVSKPGRLAVIDGQSSFLQIDSRFVTRSSTGTELVGWLGDLADLYQILDSEVRLARDQCAEAVLSYVTGAAGPLTPVITIEATGQSGSNVIDSSKNAWIARSDNVRVYEFDPETKFVRNLKVYVHSDAGDVLALEIIAIEYDFEMTRIAPAIFTYKLPDDAVWFGAPQPLGQGYQRMRPEEVARAFFQACAKEDWDQVSRLRCLSPVDEYGKDLLGRLEIISIGIPFQCGLYPGWFVPYKIELKCGTIKEWNLAVRNDNAARRYVVDGGI